MMYIEWKRLQTRGAVEPGPDETVEGSLLVGDRICSWEDNYSSYGCDWSQLYPAFFKGERCWVRRNVRCPALGYSASGCEEIVLSFQKGVEILIEQGMFLFPTPEEV